jgi:zinc transport system substrate-binding protein
VSESLRRRATLAATGATVVALFAACAGPSAPAGQGVGGSGGAVEVAVSVPPQAYFVDRVGGDRVRVTVMVPPGAAPDSYEPSPQQVLGLRRARLYVEVGQAAFPFEARYLAAGSGPGPEVVDMSAGVEPLPAAAGDAHGTDGGAGEMDPHVWLAPSAVRVAARNIAAALTRADPAGAAVYEHNLAAFLADVDALDRDVRATLAGLKQRKFLVFHPAWGYFAREYGLQQVAIESGGKEPSPAQLVALIAAARRDGVKVVFVQRGFSDRAARVIASELGAEVVAVDPLAYDWLDNLRRVAEAFRRALS